MSDDIDHDKLFEACLIALRLLGQAHRHLLIGNTLSARQCQKVAVMTIRAAMGRGEPASGVTPSAGNATEEP